MTTARERGSAVVAVIAGGGTAGHVLAGVSIADELTRQRADSTAVHFVGGARGVETRLVPEAGYSLTTLPGRGLQRRLSLANLAALAGLARATVRSFGLLLRLRPAVVVGLGGYASVPCSVAAIVLRIPLLVVEQNAVPGLANRLLARFAKAAATAFESVDLPRAVWTGNPIRSEVLAVRRDADRAIARRALGVHDERRLVAVFGGSLGARSINEAVVEALDEWKQRDDLQIHHVAGPRGFPDVRAATSRFESSALAYDVVEYQQDMASLYTAADLAVSRSGATTVAELTAVGLAAVLIPLPGAPGDHQSANARLLVAAGAAVMIDDGELDGSRLAAEVDRLLDDPARLERMSRAGATMARRDAAASVVELIEKCSRNRAGRSTGTSA